MKLIIELAELAFATRLKLLSDKLSKDVSHLYSELKLDFQPRWFTMLYSLYHESPQTISELGEKLGVTHTAINNLSTEMVKVGLLSKSISKNDERIRLLSISKKGIEYAKSLFPIWEEIRLATVELIQSVDSQFLNKIKEIEDLLDESNIYERVWLKLKGQLPQKLQILKYKPAFKKYFIALNEEWLNEYFQIEDQDLKILQDPNRKIIKKGGMIFFAQLNNQIVGTCALIPHKNEVYELGKLAVTKSVRGLGIGKELVAKAINYARNSDVRELYIRSNEKLMIANDLYNSFGFSITRDSPFSEVYHRPTFIMKLKLIGDKL